MARFFCGTRTRISSTPARSTPRASRGTGSPSARCSTALERSVEFLRVPYDSAATEAKAAVFGYRINPLADRLYTLRRRTASAARRIGARLHAGRGIAVVEVRDALHPPRRRDRTARPRGRRATRATGCCARRSCRPPAGARDARARARGAARCCGSSRRGRRWRSGCLLPALMKGPRWSRPGLPSGSYMRAMSLATLRHT